MTKPKRKRVGRAQRTPADDLDAIAAQRGITAQRRVALVAAAMEQARAQDTETHLRNAQRDAKAVGSDKPGDRDHVEVVVNALTNRLAWERREGHVPPQYATHAARIIDAARRVPSSYTGGRDVLTLAIRTHPADDDSTDTPPSVPTELFAMTVSVVGGDGFERAIGGVMELAARLDGDACVDGGTIALSV